VAIRSLRNANSIIIIQLANAGAKLLHVCFKCLRFGHWLTLCTLNIHILTYLLTKLAVHEYPVYTIKQTSSKHQANMKHA